MVRIYKFYKINRKNLAIFLKPMYNYVVNSGCKEAIVCFQIKKTRIKDEKAN